MHKLGIEIGNMWKWATISPDSKIASAERCRKTDAYGINEAIWLLNLVGFIE